MGKNNKRFGRTLAGKNLASISFLAPHQNDFQKMVGKTLKKHFSGFVAAEIDIVEIGTGTGLTSIEILEANKKIILRSVDNEPKMVAEARKNLEKYISERRLDIILGDALEYLMDQPEKSADAVATSMTLHNLKKDYREKVLREILRVLKNDGLFTNADKYVPGGKREYKKELTWQMEQFEKAPTEKIKRAWLRHYKTDCRPEFIMRENDSTALMEKIGFKNIKVGPRRHLEALLTAGK